TWSRVPNPLVAQTAPLAVALEVSESMEIPDVPPSRLERAKYKILDVMEARTGARTALIAYGGSAHRVAPLTEDPAVIKPFLEGLSPKVMPKKGQNASSALELARAALATEDVPGAILFVLDDLDRVDLPAFERHAAENGPRVVFLSVGGSTAARDDLSLVPGAAVVTATPDAADIAEINRRVASAYRDALAKDERQKWDDQGWILAWPAALLLLFWFRRGWTMRWCLVLGAGLAGVPGGPAHAEGVADWFLTPDQQGRLAFEDLEFAKAGDLFEAPTWKGYALYRAGRYSEAAEIFARLQTADAAFAQGVALVKGREYRPGIEAFETALKRDPDHEAAARNLEIARTILDYLEKARAQSDTGEGSLGADEVVYDKESEGGFKMQVTEKAKAKMQTAEQWMRTVDTRTEDFLRIRFALENASTTP
ncbi:MAG: VWA domain-containing protein, partial [Hyphomicrobiales bacterium]